MQPHTHTPRHSTTHNNTASLTSAAPGVARRSPPAILATTHSAHDPLLDAHTWSPQGGGQGGEGAGPKVNRGQPHTNMGTHNAPPHSRHFPHRTQPPHMQQSTNDGMHSARWRQQRCPVPCVCDRTHKHTDTTKPRPVHAHLRWSQAACQRRFVARALAQEQQSHLSIPPVVTGINGGGASRGEGGGGWGTHSKSPQTHNSENRQPRGAPPTPAPLPKAAKG